MVGAKVGYGTREIGELLGICASVVEAMALKFSTIRKLSAVHESLSLCFIRDGRRAFWGDVWQTVFDSNGRMRLACLPARYIPCVGAKNCQNSQSSYHRKLAIR